MRIKWRYSETYSEGVVLIANLLELVDATLPESGKLDFDAISRYHPVGLGIAASYDIESLCGTPASDKLLADLPDLP